MDADALYTTFTHPKVVTSMLLIGIGLGLGLSVLLRLFWGAWYLPVAFIALAFGIVVLYMVWLDRQDFRDELVPDLRNEPGPEKNPDPSLIIPTHRPGFTGPPTRYALFTNRRVIASMFLLCIGLGIALCVIIVLFRGTWYLPALFTALTVGTVAVYLYWLDTQDFSRDEVPGH
jgi:hypothetical protein